MLRKEIQEIKTKQIQFDKNMTDIKIIIEDLKNKNNKLIEDNEILINKNKKAKKIIRGYNKMLEEEGLDTIEKIIEIINEKNNVEKIMASWGVSSLNEVTEIINKNKHDNDEIENIIVDYNLSINNKEFINITYEDDIINKIHEDENINNKMINTPSIKINTKNCIIKGCKNIIKCKYDYCNYHYKLNIKKDNMEKIKKYSKFYNLEININKIPIIVEHHKYELSNFSDYQIVPYFDINKHFHDMFSYLIKYNLSFNIKKTKKENCNINNERKEYEKTNQGDKINNLLDKIVKEIGHVKNKDFYDKRLNTNKRLIDSYNYYYLHNSKLNEYEKASFFEEQKINKSNMSRFNKFTKIYNKIIKEKEIFESEYIFLPHIFKDINIKSIDNLIYKLKLLCNKKYSLEEIKENKFLEVDSNYE